MPFDVYLRLGPDKLAKIFSKGSPIETPRLEGYILKGIRQFHIRKEDRRLYTHLTGGLLETYTSANDFIKEDAQHILDQAAENVIYDIFLEHELSSLTYKMTTKVVNSYVSIAKSAPGVLPQMLKLAKTKKEVVRHSIMTSIFSTLLARAHSPADQALWLNAGLAGFLHDIGMSELSGNVDEHSLTLPAELKKQVHHHPRFSAEALDGTGISPVIQNAIRAHHEYWDGSGYPRGLKGEDIPIIARIITLSEQFATLVNGSESGFALTPQLAILALKKSNKMDPALMDIFASMLKIAA